MASTAIPGCATQGEALVELLENPHEAIEGCLSVDITGRRVGRAFMNDAIPCFPGSPETISNAAARDCRGSAS